MNNAKVLNVLVQVARAPTKPTIFAALVGWLFDATTTETLMAEFNIQPQFRKRCAAEGRQRGTHPLGYCRRPGDSSWTTWQGTCESSHSRLQVEYLPDHE